MRTTINELVESTSAINELKPKNHLLPTTPQHEQSPTNQCKQQPPKTPKPSQINKINN